MHACFLASNLHFAKRISLLILAQVYCELSFSLTTTVQCRQAEEFVRLLGCKRKQWKKLEKSREGGVVNFTMIDLENGKKTFWRFCCRTSGNERVHQCRLDGCEHLMNDRSVGSILHCVAFVVICWFKWLLSVCLQLFNVWMVLCFRINLLNATCKHNYNVNTKKLKSFYYHQIVGDLRSPVLKARSSNCGSAWFPHYWFRYRIHYQ